MAKRIDEMSAQELWTAASRALSERRLREAKALLDEIGLRYDAAYTRLEEMALGSGDESGEKVWS